MHIGKPFHTIPRTILHLIFFFQSYIIKYLLAFLSFGRNIKLGYFYRINIVGHDFYNPSTHLKNKSHVQVCVQGFMTENIKLSELKWTSSTFPLKLYNVHFSSCLPWVTCTWVWTQTLHECHWLFPKKSLRFSLLCGLNDSENLCAHEKRLVYSALISLLTGPIWVASEDKEEEQENTGEEMVWEYYNLYLLLN